MEQTGGAGSHDWVESAAHGAAGAEQAPSEPMRFDESLRAAANLHDRPTRRDPAIVPLRPGKWLVCWVAPVDGEDRWISVTPDARKHVGPVYCGEASLDDVGDTMRRWWAFYEGRRAPRDLTLMPRA